MGDAYDGGPVAVADEATPGTGDARRMRLAQLVSAMGAGGADEGTARPSPYGAVESAPAPVATAGPSAAAPTQTPAQAGTTAQDEGRAHLADLIRQQQQLEAPAKPESLGHKVLKYAIRFAPLAAAMIGGNRQAMAGAGKGTAAAMERNKALELNQQAIQRGKEQTLAQQIEAERGRQEQEESQREIEGQRGQIEANTLAQRMTEQDKLEAAREDARDRTLAETIAAQSDRQQAGFEQQDKLLHERQAEQEKLEAEKESAARAMANLKATLGPNKIPPLVGKAFDDYQNSQSRLDIMTQNLDAGLKGDQQAMLSLLANHLGMTMGLAKGARINQTIITEAMKSAPWLGRIEARFDSRGYLTGVTLTPDQMQSMVMLAQNRFSEDARKVTAMEEYFGVRGGTEVGGGGGGGAAHPQVQHLTNFQINPKTHERIGYDTVSKKWVAAPKTAQ